MLYCSTYLIRVNMSQYVLKLAKELRAGVQPFDVKAIDKIVEGVLSIPLDFCCAWLFWLSSELAVSNATVVVCFAER